MLYTLGPRCNPLYLFWFVLHLHATSELSDEYPVFEFFNKLCSLGGGASGARLGFPLRALNLSFAGLPSTGSLFLFLKKHYTKKQTKHQLTAIITQNILR